MNNLERYTKIFMDTFDISKDEAARAKFHEIVRWDSIGQMSLIAALEEEFDIYFEPEDIILVTSFEDGKEVLKKYDVEL